MKTLEELFATIETHEMSARMNTASGFEGALEIARTQPDVRELASRIPSENLEPQILKRVLALTLPASDIRYEHRHDAALTIYMHVLSEWSETFGFAAAAITSYVPNLWWASKLAARILERSGKNAARVVRDDPSQITGPDSGDALFVLDVRGVFVDANITVAESWSSERDAGNVEARPTLATR